MSEQVEALPAQAIASDSRTTISWRDFLELTKPRVVALMILTSVIGMLLAAPGVPGWGPELVNMATATHPVPTMGIHQNNRFISIAIPEQRRCN